MKRYVHFWFLAMVLTILSVSLSSVIYGASEDHKYYVAGSQAKRDSPSFLYLLNPNLDDTEIRTTLYYEDGVGESKNLILKANTQGTVDLRDYDKSGMPFGMMIDSAVPIVIQHVQYDEPNSAAIGMTAADNAEKIWEFGEGYSTGSAKTWLYILNPGKKSADVQVTVYTEDGAKKVFNVDVPSERMKKIDMKEKIYSQKRYGLRLVSDQPVVVSSANYDKLFSGGSGGHGGNRAKTWYFAAGIASDTDTDFLNIVNPTLDDAKVNLTFYYADGEEGSVAVDVEHLMKKHIMLNNYARPEKEYSIVVYSDVEVVVERTHYDDEMSAGHGGLGETWGAKDWMFAIGSTAQRNYLAVYNPGKEQELEVVLLGPDGDAAYGYQDAPHGRSTINLDEVDADTFGVIVNGQDTLFIEQVVYDKIYDAGYSMFGVKGFSSDTTSTSEAVDDVEKDVDMPITGNAVKEPVLSIYDIEDVDRKSFSEEVRPGLASVEKTTYEYDGRKILLWKFRYTNRKTASDGLQQVLSGALMKVMEYSGTRLNGIEVYSLVSDNSQGYAWQENDELLVAIAKDKEDAMVVVEDVGSPWNYSFWTTQNTMLLAVAFMLIFLMAASMLRKPKEKGDPIEENVEYKVYTGDDPDMGKTIVKKGKVKKRSVKKSPVKKKKPKPVKKKEERPDSNDKAKDEAKDEAKDDAKDEDIKIEKIKEPEKVDKEEQQDKEERQDEKPEVRIEKQEPKKEVEKIDNPEVNIEVVDYDEVFRHVNRDGDEVRPKDD